MSTLLAQLHRRSAQEKQRNEQRKRQRATEKASEEGTKRCAAIDGGQAVHNTCSLDSTNGSSSVTFTAEGQLLGEPACPAQLAKPSTCPNFCPLPSVAVQASACARCYVAAPGGQQSTAVQLQLVLQPVRCSGQLEVALLGTTWSQCCLAAATGRQKPHK